jgi:hypothetical protein
MVMLEDILYLVAYNGYSKDIGPAALCSKATLTDERIWFPHLIQQTYGPKNKTRLQILTEHTTLLLGDVKQHIILTKDKPLIYRSEKRWIQRLNQLQEMAKKAMHSDILQTMLSIPDATGRAVISVASENNCPTIISYLLKRGIAYNETDDSGATPSYYAFTSRFGRQAFYSLPLNAEYGYPRPIERVIDWEVVFNQPAIPQPDIVFGEWNIELMVNSQPQPKKKKMKSKLYKQQFGPKR